MKPGRIYHHPDARSWLSLWAADFELIESAEPPVHLQAPALWACADHLELLLGGGRAAGARAAGAWVKATEVRRRAQQAPELLRACAVAPGTRVLDAMAGWGLDGLVLAAAGACVTMIEREPMMQALQRDLIRRLDARSVVSRLGDGFCYLDAGRAFDVIYLDPMFPERKKRALPGKRMQFLTVLASQAGVDRPIADWLAAAIPAARHRVVVKRRLHDDAGLAPDWQIRGRSIRYDVYRGRALSAPEERRIESQDR